MMMHIIKVSSSFLGPLGVEFDCINACQSAGAKPAGDQQISAHTIPVLSSARVPNGFPRN